MKMTMEQKKPLTKIDWAKPIFGPTIFMIASFDTKAAIEALIKKAPRRLYDLTNMMK
jgi:hypothetical protein